MSLSGLSSSGMGMGMGMGRVSSAGAGMGMGVGLGMDRPSGSDRGSSCAPPLCPLDEDLLLPPVGACGKHAGA